MRSRESKNSRNESLRVSRKFLSLLKNEKPKRVLFVCHRSADPDSYLSSYALANLVRRVAGSRTSVAIPQGEVEVVRRLRQKYRMREAKQEMSYDISIAVDVGNIELLGEWKEKFLNSKSILVDHHPHTDLDYYTVAIVDQLAVSTSEIVLRIFELARLKPSLLVSQAMLDAMIYDSQHLSIATENTLIAAAKLISLGASLDLARDEIRTERSYDQVIARLKSAMRMYLYRAGEWLIAFTKVNSFQAQCARSIVQIGADVAFAGGVTDGTTRVSIRSTQNFFVRTGIHLGNDIAARAASELGGLGGGHSTAASFECSAPIEDALAKCRNIIERALSLSMKRIMP